VDVEKTIQNARAPPKTALEINGQPTGRNLTGRQRAAGTRAEQGAPLAVNTDEPCDGAFLDFMSTAVTVRAAWLRGRAF